MSSKVYSSRNRTDPIDVSLTAQEDQEGGSILIKFLYKHDRINRLFINTRSMIKTWSMASLKPGA